MADDPIAQDSAAVGGGHTAPQQEMVTIPHQQYMLLASMIESQGRQIKAMNNVHHLLQQKDAELIASRERNESISTELLNAEVRSACLLKTLAKVQRDSDGQLRTLTSNEITSSIADTSNDPRIRPGASLQRQSTLEADGAVEYEPPLPTTVACLMLGKDSNFPSNDDCQMAPTVSRVYGNDDSVARQIKTSTQDYTLHSMPQVTSEDAVYVSEPATSLPHSSSKKQSLPSDCLSASSRTMPNISNNLLDKLMQQNSKLKKVLRDILSARNLSVSDYLDKQEYEDVITQLRQDILIGRRRIDELETVIATAKKGDTNTLARNCAQLQDRVHNLEKLVAIRQVMIEGYSRKYEQMKEELNELKLQRQAPSSSPVAAASLPPVGSTSTELQQDAVEKLNTELKQYKQKFSELEKKNTELEFMNQTLNTQLTAARIQRDKYKQELDSPRPAVPAIVKQWSVPATSSTRCGSSTNMAWLTETPQTGLVMDGAQSMPHEEAMENVDRAPAGTQPSAVSGEKLVCQRCEREFNASDRTRFEEHCKKCVE